MDRTGKIVKIRIGNGVRYENLPQEAKEKIYFDLSFDNPKYTQAKRHGKFIGADTKPFLYFFKITADKKVVWTPRGYIWYMKKWLKQNNYEVKIDDRTLLLPPIDVKFQGKLRNYQDVAANDMIRRYPVGVLEASTGAGKTVMGTGIIALRQQPTLIIVHTKELLYQWEEAIKNFLDYDCGLLGDGMNTIKDITVGIINSVRNKTDNLVDNFGQIIVDECHRCPSTVWTETLSEFPARHYLGLSATPFRKDGLGNAINAHIGPKIHIVNKEDLHESGAVLKPQIILVKTNYKFGRGPLDELQVSYAEIIKALTTNDRRNELIGRTIRDDIKRYKQNALIVSDRVTHCKKLAHILSAMGVKSRVLHGKVSTKERKEIVADVKAGKVKALIATLSLIGEGFDAPNLSALHLTTPIKFSGRVIQTVGRVLRPEEGKIPRVFDYRDENVKVLRYSGFHRNRIYKEQWS